ncbi:putative cation:proton antiport protein [Anaerohalosphaera lusitana]|uniref:Putative cation:proton antiport protein n=1 Tax=Anaerohalosphaera lusitana TaxID=1936003 RepID=A0A1U9NI49_9BACT|nr:cation:proton antiporter [Anaerohalosphaera lusitana]AQT67603.1 putative cation:proton antiport protein [Anaerohalosphaera lusitana]
MFYLAFTLVAVIALAAVFKWAAEHIRLPSVVALIIAGLVLAYPPIRERIIGGHEHTITMIGDAGLLALMFMAGLESSWRMLYKEKEEAAYIAVFAAFVPLVVGAAAFWLMGYELSTSLIVGVCMSISAEATRAKVLMELDKLNTRVGSALIGAGLIDDTIGLSLFVLITYFIEEGGSNEQLLVVASIICFFAGLAIKRVVGREPKTMVYLEKVLNVCLVPFFFVSIGLHFDFQSLVMNAWILVAVIAIATLGKFAGVFLTKFFLDLSYKQLHLISWSMNSRGALEMALALVAFRSGLIHSKLYSSLVVMTLVTTLVFPFIMTYMVHRDPKIMK